MTSKVCQLIQQTLLTTVIHNFECPAVDPRKYKRTEAYITYSTVNDGEGLVGCRPFVGELDQLRNSEEFLRFERQTKLHMYKRCATRPQVSPYIEVNR